MYGMWAGYRRNCKEQKVFVWNNDAPFSGNETQNVHF